MMGFFDIFKRKPELVAVPEVKEPPVPKEKKVKEEPKTAKQIATDNKEPYVNIVSLDVDLDNLHQGAFELDWNDIFVARLIKSGYQGKTDQDIVDNWFQDVCRNVVLETYQQEQADPSNRPSNRKDLGDGRVEIS
jgi:hypothetical protein